MSALAFTIGQPVMREIDDSFLIVHKAYQQDGAEWLELLNPGHPERSFNARADTCCGIRATPMPPNLWRRA